jgi:hypothetical protein
VRQRKAVSQIAFRQPAKPAAQNAPRQKPLSGEGDRPLQTPTRSVNPTTMHGTYNKRITCNLRNRDYRRLKETAEQAGMSLAPFLRSAALAYLDSNFIVPPRLDELLARLIAETRRVGNNVNQIAAKANALQSVSGEDIHRLKEKVADLEHVTRLLRRVIHNLEPQR